MSAVPDSAPPTVPRGEAFRLWAKLGVLSFGGPAGQIALMHRLLVDERKWLGEDRFLHALNFCMLLPGPEAMQLATYVGWLLHGWLGGLVAGLLFVVPGALVVLGLAAVYAAFGEAVVPEAVFFGVKAAVLAIVLEALMRIARRALKSRPDWAIAGGAFLAMFVFDAPFPLVVLTAGLIGLVRGTNGGPADRPAIAARGPAISLSRTAATALTWLSLWLGPLVLLSAAFGPDHVYAQLAWFFSKLAVVTFGGAYAVLAYMAQEAVEGYGWLSPGQMLDGLGLAETTPGPLILVTEFVGFLAGYGHAGGRSIVMGVIGAGITLWATFAPCFLWIFVGAPYVERLRHKTRIAGALGAITAAVVGVVLNLSVWFGLHVLFAELSAWSWGPVEILVPSAASLDWAAAVLFAGAAVALFGFHLGILRTLGLSAIVGVGWRFLG